MSSISELVDHACSIVSSMRADDFVSRSGELQPDHAVVIKLQKSHFVDSFNEMIGKENVERFYTDCGPQCLAVATIEIIMAAVRPDGGKTVRLDKEYFQERLTRLQSVIVAGEVTYSLSYRLVNLDLDDEFQLGNGILIRKLPFDAMLERFPPNSAFHTLQPLVAKYHHKHLCEAVVQGKGTLAEARGRASIENSNSIVNSIENAFLISDVGEKCVPKVSHFRFDSDVESFIMNHGSTSFTFEPYKLSHQDISDLQAKFALLRDAEQDRVLETVLDRFILGIKRQTHHPNRMNKPNWDKVVDYAIAMETLFLTVDGGDISGELAYRFRMNGSCLISVATGEDREVLFDALNHMYTLRSKVVHGGSDSDILKAANKFIHSLDIERKDHQHGLGRLLIIDKQVRNWLKSSIEYVSGMRIEDRPYKVRRGWERMIWSAAK